MHSICFAQASATLRCNVYRALALSFSALETVTVCSAGIEKGDIKYYVHHWSLLCFAGCRFAAHRARRRWSQRKCSVVQRLVPKVGHTLHLLVCAVAQYCCHKNFSSWFSTSRRCLHMSGESCYDVLNPYVISFSYRKHFLIDKCFQHAPLMLAMLSVLWWKILDVFSKYFSGLLR